MKDYLRRLARGNFIYDTGRLACPQEPLEMQVTEGQAADGSFTVSATQPSKGLVMSSNSRVSVKEHVFGGTRFTVSYTVDAAGLAAGDEIRGCFCLISSAGEAEIPYCFRTAVQTLETSSGRIYNLFHFANLVQSAPEEAEAIFQKPVFKQMFLKTDASLANIYDLLFKTGSVQESIEEFLIAARKKIPVHISVSEERKHYEHFQADMQDQVMLSKSGWGHAKVSIYTDCPFIRLETDLVTSDDFMGGRYELRYVLERAGMHAGKNFGKIYMRTFQQELVLSVEADCEGMPQTLRERRQALEKLAREYMDYRMKKIDMTDWLRHSGRILDRIRGMGDEHMYFRLFQAQLDLIQNRHQEGQWLLEHVKNELDMLDAQEGRNEENVELYCYYLYIRSLGMKDEKYTAQAANTIRNYFENGYDTWRLLWLLFYMDPAYSRNQSIKLIRIKDACHTGCTSPIMYIEALSVMNAQPVLLRVLNRFELRVLNFGCKYGLITKKLAHHAAALICSEKVATEPMLRILYSLYTQFAEDDILAALVTHMIRNELVDGRCFLLYEKGILRGLRITQLYEYYLQSMDKSQMRRLPKMVLMYFAYDSALDHAAKAYLYANVLENESRNAELMQVYMPQIEHFGYEQMKAGRIDDNLAAIYRAIWDVSLVDGQTAEFMIRFMFTYKVTCFGQNAQAVIVSHREFKGEEAYQLTDHAAYVQMYTDGCALAIEDSDGVRHRDSVQYEVERVFEDYSLLDVLRAYGTDHLGLRMYLFENRRRLELDSGETLADVLFLMRHDRTAEETVQRLNSWLISYYGQEDAELEQAYGNILTDSLSAADAVRLTETCISKRLYEYAYRLVQAYGFENVSPVKMFRLARHMLELNDGREDSLLTDICMYAFMHKKYNEEILSYLAAFCNGTNEQMYIIWKACRNFQVDSRPLAERLIAQMMFTGEQSGRMSEVFGSYYSSGASGLVVSAYAAYHSFLYFVKQQKTDDIVFRVLKEQIREDRGMPDICRLALLKHFSDRPEKLPDASRSLAQALLDEMCSQGKLFECYKKFAGVLDIPYNMIDKTVIEYRSAPESRVEIHYTKNGNEDEPVTEVMQCVDGVYTKCLTLFYGESIQYYFTEERDGGQAKTESASFLCGTVNPRQAEGRFDGINDMLASREMHDMVTMKKLMQGYSVQEYVVQQMFKPLQP